MRAEDLKLEELIDFSEGYVSLHGRRLVIHDMHSFAQLRRDLVQMAGMENARRILTRFGSFWGEADAAAMNRIFTWDSTEEWLLAGPRMHGLQGVVRPVVKSLEMDPPTGKFHMEVIWHESGEAEEHLAAFGQSHDAACWMLTGYASGYASHVLAEKIYFIEEKCQAKGDYICSAVGKDMASWGPELKSSLSYFQTEDIRGKILNLSAQLRDKMREIHRQRKRLQLLDPRQQLSFVEVRSEAFGRIVELACRVAPYDSSVLITGESGVGKEVFARHIHRLSNRSSGPFVAVNCAALPDTLLESELFGHKAGAFTGAVRDTIGLFSEANKGTIFLDEIGDISHAMQVKLLRVLQTKEVLRVGETKPRKVDARVIAATNRDLAKAVREGHFREDLYYRLRVIEIDIPPLREHPEDILPLARHIVAQFAKKLKRPKLRLDSTCLDFLQAYRWPGNVRELENAIERGAVLCQGDGILPEHLPPRIVHAALAQTDEGDSLNRTLEQVERDHIGKVLKVTGGNRTRAARILGISGATLWRKMKQIGSPAPAPIPAGEDGEAI
jgi:two-component system, NtrC family, response regulator HydG